MGWVQPGRWLDSAIMGLFLICIAGGGLHLFGEFWELTQNPQFPYKWPGFVMLKLFPFKRSFDVNLTHIILFALLIAILSLRPDHEASTYADTKKKLKAEGRSTTL